MLIIRTEMPRQENSVYQYAPWVWVGVVTLLLFYSWSRPTSCPSSESHIKYAFADLLDESKNVIGRVTFTQKDPSGPVSISIGLSGVPEGLHGFHIHEFGDVSTCNAAGAHFNPYGATHGGPSDKIRHVGDLGNVQSNSDGKINTEIIDSVISLNGPNSIMGRAVVLHSDQDDFGKGGHADSLKTGHAGSRIACGTIGVHNV
eukprot:Phypoly_transcript_16934.p1 GENE.Phypoly_transcript_16934~~Phypoly_transcript_16934.p1  ORF type:complete len:202 (+),score=16.17 Phypoly_transcript_16934:195-800(+)